MNRPSYQYNYALDLHQFQNAVQVASAQVEAAGVALRKARFDLQAVVTDVRSSDEAVASLAGRMNQAWSTLRFEQGELSSKQQFLHEFLTFSQTPQYADQASSIHAIGNEWFEPEDTVSQNLIQTALSGMSHLQIGRVGKKVESSDYEQHVRYAQPAELVPGTLVYCIDYFAFPTARQGAETNFVLSFVVKYEPGEHACWIGLPNSEVGGWKAVKVGEWALRVPL